MTIAKCVSKIRTTWNYQEVLDLCNELTTVMASIPLALQSEEAARGSGYTTFQII